MYLLELSLYEFRQFLQIVLWISLPLIIVSVTITTFLHYRRKRKRGQQELSDQDHVYDLMPPGTVQPLLSKSTNADNDAIIKQYELQLKQSRDKYHALERSFRMLQENYSAVISRLNNEDSIDNTEPEVLRDTIKTYELKIAQLEQALEYMKKNSGNGIDTTSGEVIENREKELERLESMVAKLTEELDIQVKENDHLRNGLLNTGQPLEKNEFYDERLQQLKEMLSSAEEENTLLKSNAPDTGYLEEILKEKNLQIEFLQQQLEQRIKHNHILERQQKTMSDANGQLQQMIEQSRVQVSTLGEDIKLKQHRLNSIQTELEALQDKNTSLNEFIFNSNDRITLLEEQLVIAVKDAREFETKWEQNSSLISRIYRELAGSLENEMSISNAGIITELKKEKPYTETAV